MSLLSPTVLPLSLACPRGGHSSPSRPPPPPCQAARRAARLRRGGPQDRWSSCSAPPATSRKNRRCPISPRECNRVLADIRAYCAAEQPPRPPPRALHVPAVRRVPGRVLPPQVELLPVRVRARVPPRVPRRLTTAAAAATTTIRPAAVAAATATAAALPPPSYPRLPSPPPPPPKPPPSPPPRVHHRRAAEGGRRGCDGGGLCVLNADIFEHDSQATRTLPFRGRPRAPAPPLVAVAVAPPSLFDGDDAPLGGGRRLQQELAVAARPAFRVARCLSVVGVPVHAAIVASSGAPWSARARGRG